MDQSADGRAVILFDGVCGLCNTGTDWIRARDRDGRFEFLPYQSEEARRRFPDLDPARLAQAMHVVLPDGTVRVGVDAAPWIFGALPGWGWLVRLLALPGVRRAARPVYAWLARTRTRATSGSGRTTPSPPPSRP
jgi:predicted DCC family thiol-disulfide oxidoreductase YuxK